MRTTAARWATLTSIQTPDGGWRPLGPDDQACALRAAILYLLRQRDRGKTICPSDAARAVGSEDFRPLMPVVRQVAAGLVDEGLLEVTQRGQPVNLATSRGAIRLRLKRD